jgi:cobalt-zinc-cadmium efflux system membrane fusion protein
MERRTFLLAGIAAALALTGGWWLTHKSGASSSATESTATADTPNILVIGSEQATALGIAHEAALTADEAPLAVVPAIIEPPANARVAVAATFPGVVLRTLAVEGDAVKQGQALAVISSRDILAMGAELTRATARRDVTQSNAARLTQLAREGIIAGARAEDADALAAEANADFSEKRRTLARVNANGSEGTYTLLAPIAGRITTANIQAGNPVDGTTAPYVIDAANRYEVIGQLPERLIGLVQPGMRVRIEPDVIGHIIATGSTLDPTTRSASVKAEINAAPGIVAGRTTSLSISGPAPRDAVSVPTAAVTTLGGKTIVFIATDQGYAIREVSSAGITGDRTVLLSGVRAGEAVVTQGISALKALALSL